MNQTPHVFSLPTVDMAGQKGRVALTTDIIDYIEPARAFGRDDLAADAAHGRFQRRLIAVPDQRQPVMTPLVLSITNQNQLVAIRRHENTTGSEWELIPIGAAFGKGAQVRALGAAWSDDDRVSIAVAVDDGNPSLPTRVFVAFNLRTKSTDWAAIPWLDCGTRPGVRVTGIRVVDNGDRSWTAVFAGSSGPQDNLFLISSRVKQPAFAKALVFTTAVSMDEIFDFETAVHPVLGSGIATLGTSGGTGVLTFRSFPDIDADGELASIPSVAVLPCPPGARVLEAESTREDSSTLHIAGTGSAFISGPELDNAEAARVQPVLSGQLAAAVRDLVVSNAANGSATVWGLLQNGDLMVSSRADQDAAFGPALRLCTKVQALAPAPGDRRLTTSVVLVYTDGTAAFLFLDALTHTWTESPLTVANPEGASATTVFGTTLRVIDEAGAGRGGLKVKVTASAVASVVLNDRTVYLGPDLAVETETQADGTVSVFDRAQTFTPALYRFAIDGFADHFEGNPAAGIQQQMKEVTADQLRNAMNTQGGRSVPLLPENLRTGADKNQVDVLASVMKQVAIVMQTAAAGSPGIRAVAPGSAFGVKLQPNRVADGFVVGVQANRLGVQEASQQLIDQISKRPASAQDFFEGAGRGFVDLVVSIGDGVQDTWAFVLRKANESFELIVQFGNTVLRAVVNTLNEAGAFLENAWNQTKLALDKAWEFLKFLVDWKDILRVRDVMVKATDNTLVFLSSKVGELKPQITAGFGELERELARWRKDAGGGAAPAPKPTAGTTFLSTINQVTGPIQSVLDAVTANPVVSSINRMLNSLVDELVVFEGPPQPTALVQALGDFLEGTVADQFDNLQTTVQSLISDITLIFQGRMPALGELTVDGLKNAIVRLGVDALQGLLKVLSSLLLRFVDLLKDLIEFCRVVIFSKLRLPFIENLVKLVTGGAVQVDTNFRIVDALLLLCAVPATLGYKIATGKAPFAPGEVVVFPVGAPVTAQGANLGVVVTELISTSLGWLLVAVQAVQKVRSIPKPNQAQAPARDGSFDWLAGVGLTAQVCSWVTQILESNLATKPLADASVKAFEGIDIVLAGLELLRPFAVPALRQRRKLRSLPPMLPAEVEKLLKTLAIIDVGTNVVVILSRTASYSITTGRRPTNVPPGLTPFEKETLEDQRNFGLADQTLGWLGVVFDKTGGALIAASEFSGLATPKNAGLVVAGLAAKGVGLAALSGKAYVSLNLLK